jgi:hypothetical protein
VVYPEPHDRGWNDEPQKAFYRKEEKTDDADALQQ